LAGIGPTDPAVWGDAILTIWKSLELKLVPQKCCPPPVLATGEGQKFRGLKKPQAVPKIAQVVESKEKSSKEKLEGYNFLPAGGKGGGAPCNALPLFMLACCTLENCIGNN
jgi:hypothetical protein